MTALPSSRAAFGRGPTYALIATVALVAMSDVLFYGHLIGWSAGLFTAALLAAIVLRPAMDGSGRVRWVLAAAVGGLAITMVEEPTWLALVVAFVAIVVLAMTWRHGWTASASAWARRWLAFIGLGWLTVFRDLQAGLAAMQGPASERDPAPAAALREIGKWALPVLLGGGFLALFAMANSIVERALTAAYQWVTDRVVSLGEGFEVQRVLFWSGMFVATWALLQVRDQKPRTIARLQPTSPDHTILMPSRRGLVERCLIVFNLVFAVETVLDILYLWGGRQLPAGMSFKEYAHRGSYPLVATALLSAGFVLLTFRRECQGDSWRRARLLVYGWLAQNVLLTISAGWRLYLLVNASNLTRLRLATTIWLGLVVLGLLSIVWRIVTRRDNGWLLGVNVFMTTVVVYACCFLNLDGFIAGYNADHCLDVARNGDVLGLTYLRDLGIESIPALDRLSRTLDTPERRGMAGYFANELRARAREEVSDWRGWTWRRSRLARTHDVVVESVRREQDLQARRLRGDFTTPDRVRSTQHW